MINISTYFNTVRFPVNPRELDFRNKPMRFPVNPR